MFLVSKTVLGCGKIWHKEGINRPFFSLRLISFRLSFSRRYALFHFIASVFGWAFLIILSLSGQRWADSNHHFITLYCLLYTIITMTVLSFFCSLYDSCILHPRRIFILCLSIRRSLLSVLFSVRYSSGVFIGTSSNSCYILDASRRSRLALFLYWFFHGSRLEI